MAVLSHNRLDELARNLPKLIHNCAELGYELVVADNGSNAEVRSFLAKVATSKPDVVLLQNEANLGLGRGRNTAFAAANGELVLSIDDDTRVSCGVLRRLPSLMRQKYPHVGILTLRVKHPHGDQDQNFAGEHEVPVRNHHGSACVIRREVLARVGGIDDYFDFGTEEIDLCIRTHAAGYQILYTPDLIVYHNSFLRPGPEGFDRRRKWIFNNARTMHKYFPVWMAQTQSTRYFLWATRGLIMGGNVLAFSRLLAAHLRGCCVGLRYRTPVPPGTVAYYADPNLLPDLGNKPCFRAGLKRRLRKRVSWSGGSSNNLPLDPPA